MRRPARALLCLLAACSAGEPPRAEKAALRAGVVARVDGEPIYAETVAAIAREQGVSAEVGLERSIFDALIGREARARGVDRRTHTQQSAELAKLLIAEVAREARAKGEPTEDELGPYVEGRWWELNRPDAVVVAHILVHAAKPSQVDPAVDEAALAVARKIRAAVAPLQPDVRKAKQPDFKVVTGVPFELDPIIPQFDELGLAVARDDLTVTAEHLPPLGADGYVVQPGTPVMIEGPFVKAAFALKERGDLSEPVRGDNGWHVILLLGKTAGHQAPRSELLLRFGEIVIEERARTMLAEIVARGRKEHDATLERSTDELTQQVKVGR